MRACIDIGGTKISVSLNDGRSHDLVARRNEPTAKSGTRDAVARQILRMVDEACAEAGVAPEAVQAAGVASCGPFVRVDGAIEIAAPNICGGLAGPPGRLPNNWTSAVLESPLARRFARLRLENDGIAALEAERRWGALQGIDDCAYVTWSTGVGTGLCVGGRVLRGKNGNAGHAGHAFVADDDRIQCGCGNVGDLEALVGGTFARPRFGIDAATLMQRAREGDAQSLAAVDGLCRAMGRGLYNLVATLDLQRISLGGSVFCHNQDLLLPRLQAEVRSHLAALTAGCDLVPAGLGERVGDYAALALLD